MKLKVQSVMEKVCTSQKIVFLHVKLTKAYFLRQVKMSLEAAIAVRATALHPNKVFNQRASARVLKVVLLAVLFELVFLNFLVNIAHK